jgi:hypothetical protein
MSERNTKSYKKLPPSYYTEQAKKDRELGQQGEREVLELINNWFDCKFHMDKSWREMDYICGEKRYACELKTRRIAVNTYPTILISSNKIFECIRLNKLGFRTFLIFKLTDDIYFYEMKKTDIPTEFISSFCERQDRGCKERHSAYYIPTYLLKKFSDYKDKTDYDNIEMNLTIR